MVDVPIFDTTSAYPPSHIAIDDSDRRMALRSQTAGSNSAYHKMCQNEREIWENSRRSPVDKFVRDLYWRLIKVKRQTDGLETEEEKGKLGLTITSTSILILTPARSSRVCRRLQALRPLPRRHERE